MRKPVLETPRLTYRRQADAPREDPGRGIPFHLAVYGRLDRLGTWAAESSATGEFLGWFHFRPGPDADITNIDLGYRLRRAAWNQGYATEGSRPWSAGDSPTSAWSGYSRTR